MDTFLQQEIQFLFYFFLCFFTPFDFTLVFKVLPYLYEADTFWSHLSNLSIFRIHYSFPFSHKLYCYSTSLSLLLSIKDQSISLSLFLRVFLLLSHCLSPCLPPSLSFSVNVSLLMSLSESLSLCLTLRLSLPHLLLCLSDFSFI